MNYKDVALLNSSLDQLGDNLLKQRMLDQQAEERKASQAIANRRTDIDEQRMAAEQTHYNNMGNAAAAQTAAKQKDAANRTWSDTVKMIGGWVKDGVVDPNVAQQKITAAYQAMPDAQKQMLADHPAVQALQDGKPFWKAPPPKADFNTKEIANTKAREAQMARAKDLRAQAASESDATSTERQVMLQQADEIEKNAMLDFPQAGATKPERTVSVADKQGDQVVTQRMSPDEYQQYQNKNLPTAPTDIKLRKPGARYKLPNGKIGVWQGTGWQLQEPATKQ